MELLTLIQTGKTAPAPVVLLDEAGGTFWPAFAKFLDAETASRGLIDADDLELILCTDNVYVAAEEVLGFYRNYHSLRWVGEQLVLRMQHGITDDQLADLNREFGEIATDGRIDRTAPLAAERRDNDHVDLERVILRYNGFAAGKLRRLINAINAL
jgi:hypothetical protein